MQAFPHHYTVTASGKPQGEIELTEPRLESIISAAPAEFDGPGDRWSPETLLVASIADCFVLTFRAVAQASKLSWISLSCTVEGTLDRVDRITRFTDFLVRVALVVPPDVGEDRARKLLEKSERGCLVTNSLSGSTSLEASVSVQQPS